MILLAVETSCDETSAAVIRNGRVLSNVVSSQIKLHAEYGGVVPELATREHLRNWQPVTEAALRAAAVTVKELDAVAATQGPGLPNALMIGFKAAQAMAFALRKPFVGVNHHEAHLYSPWICGNPPAADFGSFQPNVSLIVSGGHTMLVHVRAELEHVVLGSTLDDAAGECFDKVAKLIGLPYPGGPEMDRLAVEGNAKAFDFPRPLLREANDDFSFAGLKTSVRYFLQKNPALLEDGKALRDLCASVQAAIVETLVTKTMRAARRLNVKCVTASGGVTCNRSLRAGLEKECGRAGLSLRLAERSLCTDNAAMIGVLAERKLLKGVSATSPDAEIEPGWSIG
ncbi:MAG: tRNA (adenosine(37)-N6)-threonylcarbamoyltransferase complex transferase subunit TsaD [Verrucomicrobia bacterium]|nr:tRNA (adenosine(37)-N6)-threonylcarbamoyltransferase complex transferase subunit TsaD [Verrucomicrobiota bacterium]